MAEKKPFYRNRNPGFFEKKKNAFYDKTIGRSGYQKNIENYFKKDASEGKVSKRLQFKRKVEEGNMFSSVMNSNWWVMDMIIDQPCFVFPSEVKDNLAEDTFLYGLKKRIDAKTEDETGTNSEGFKSILKEILSFLVFNPFFWWYRDGSKFYEKRDKDAEDMRKWGNTGIIDAPYWLVLYNFVTKILFCILKFLGSPLLILYYALLMFYALMISLKIDDVFFSLVGTLRVVPLPGFFGISQFWFRNKTTWALNPETKEYEISENPEDTVYGMLDPIRYLIGMVVPYQLFSESYGKTYGQGGVSALILIFMAIATVIIIVGGLNILVISSVFIYYIYKLISALNSSVKK